MSSSEGNSSDDDQTGFSSNTAPPSDLKDNQKRWLVIGICLHDILSPVLRKYIESEINQLYTSLVTSNNINAQLYNNGFLERYPPSSNGYRLNYETINNNKAFYKGQVKLYDYKVQNAVDFSKLFLQQLTIAHYTAFDESCDSSALLAILINVDTFSAVVQHDANAIRSNIRNPWAHCDFSQWDTGRNVYSIQLMINLVKKLSLILSEENRIIGDLNRWGTTGLNFLSGTTIGLELVTEIRHRTRILSKHIRDSTKHASETDNNLTEVRNVIKALKDTVDTMDGKMSKLEEEVQKVSNKDEMHSFSMETCHWRQIDDNTRMLQIEGNKQNTHGKTFKALKSADENLHERMTQIEDEQRRLIENNTCQDKETIPKNIQGTNISNNNMIKSTHTFITFDVCF
ncbi:uncharacterized protein LOC143057428 [Mytilus galloprovincialis]|uniref:uncharacterized protein LOC143057428 n=1 Tax=Mytilus galloprovincialis TaxID=29158 RepID=UPI003F7C3D57